MTNSDAIASRLARLEATEAIRNLKARYLTACDLKQVEVMRGCFIEGKMVLDYGPVGFFNSAEELVEMYSKFACNEHVLDVHLGGNPQIEIIDDNHARGTWCLHFFQIHTAANTVLQLGGYYDDEYVRIDGEWKISSCRFKPSATELLGIEDGMHKIKFTGKALQKFG